MTDEELHIVDVLFRQDGERVRLMKDALVLACQVFRFAKHNDDCANKDIDDCTCGLGPSLVAFRDAVKELASK
jgi:hypothetical protein